MNNKIDLKLKKQLIRFLFAGFSAVATDMLVYYLLMDLMSKSLAKGISFFAGSTVAFILNKFWTFEKKEMDLSEIYKFGVLYTGTLIANVGVNKLVLLLFPMAVLVGFICATGTSTILNFIGQKWWVFRDKEDEYICHSTHSN